MNNIYAIYTYRFFKKNDAGDWTQSVQVSDVDMSKAQDMFYELFEKKGKKFRVQKVVGDGAKKYQCDVYGNDHRIVALRLLNSKKKDYKILEADPHDPMGKVNKRSVDDTPETYVIIDCRPQCNIFAIKKETDAWRNTDVVRDLMEESINHHLESLSKGFRVQLITKLLPREFNSYYRQRINKEGRAVKKVTFYFKTGKLDPKVEAVVKTSRYLKRLFSLINEYEGQSGELTLNHPNGRMLADRHRHVIENIIMLIASDPKGYGIDLTFDDNITLHCGKDVRAELPMSPEGALELFHLGRKKEQQTTIDFDNPQKVDDGRYYLEGWLDNMAEETKKMKDAEKVKPRRSRANRRKAS